MKVRSRKLLLTRAILANSKAKTIRNPLRTDPTRTTGMREHFCRFIDRQFDKLKADVLRAVGKEDWLGVGGLEQRDSIVPAGQVRNVTVGRTGSHSDRVSLYQPFVCNGEVGYFPSRGLIEVPDVRQSDPTSCGAAAAMSVAEYFAVAPSMTLENWKTDLGTSEEGTHPEAIVKYLRGLGLQVEAFKHGNLNTLDGYLDKGWPVLCCVQDYGPSHSWEHGHYLVVIGYKEGYLFAQDPAMDNVMVDGHSKPISELGSLHVPGRVMIPEEEFLTAWHDEDEHGVPYVRFGIAVGPAVTANCNPSQMRGADGRCGPGIGLDIKREDMPQIRKDDMEDFFKFCFDHGVYVSKDSVPASDLKPTQGEFRQERVDALPDEALKYTVLVSEDNYILDGTHRWIKHWQKDKQSRVPLLRVGLPVREAIDLMRKFPKAQFVENSRWAFATSSGKLAAFGRWLQTRVSDLISGRTMKEAWRKYIEAGWRKGAARAFDDTTQRRKWERHPDTIGTGFYQGGREEFLRSSFNHPESVEKVKLLAARTFTDLDGVTTAMSTKMTRTLADGLTRGEHPYQVAANLVRDVDGIGRRRARMVAQHNFIYAHSEGQLDNLERLGVEEVGVAVEWAVTDDQKLCPACAAMQGIVLKTKNAHGLIPYHVGCRCAFIPSFDPPSSLEEVEAAVEGGELDMEPKGILNYNPSERRGSDGRWTVIDWIVGKRKADSKFIANTVDKLKKEYNYHGDITVHNKHGESFIVGGKKAFTQAQCKKPVPKEQAVMVKCYRGDGTTVYGGIQ